MRYRDILFADAVAIIAGSVAYRIGKAIQPERFEFRELFSPEVLYSVAYIAVGSIPFVMVSMLALLICRRMGFGRLKTAGYMSSLAIILSAILFIPILAIILKEGPDPELISALATPLSALMAMLHFTQKASERPWPDKPFGFLEV